MPEISDDQGRPSPPATTLMAAAASVELNLDLLGRYELGRLLGCGAFAKVYHARDLRTGQSVAIKSVSKLRVMKGGLAAHVKREISIMRRLRHPHIARLREVLATKTKIYFVMEFAKGGELFSKLAKGRFSEDLSRRCFQQLISAVRHCHAHGIYHRDLKPENLLLDENYDLKVTDFGLSALTDQIRPDGLLHTLCGTPAYVAPEVLAKRGYDGAQVDIWSCGIILFVMNAGYLPFNDPNLMVMYRKIYKGEFRSPKWTSPELKRLLTRLLDTNPASRITMDEITRDAWFVKGGVKEIKAPHDLDDEFISFSKKLRIIGSDDDDDDDDGDNKYLNAFDLISCGLDISGLFKSNGYSSSSSSSVTVDVERFISAEPPEKIVEKIAEVVEKEGVRVVNKDEKGKGLRLEGEKCTFKAAVEINRLTEELVVVEVMKREARGGCVIPNSNNKNGGLIWKDKIRPKLNCLIYQPQ